MMPLLCAVLAAAAKLHPATLVDCHDGDTCTFDMVVSDQELNLVPDLNHHIVITKKDQRVRLCDIDAPEMHGDNPAAATKARDDLLAWMRNAKTLEVVVAQKTTCTGSCDATDKYGRMLAWIYADGVNMNRLQVEQGNAVPFMRCPGGAP